MTHISDGFRMCLVAHHDGYGSCLKCSKCGQRIRPYNVNEPCPGKSPEQKARDAERQVELAKMITWCTTAVDDGN